MAMLIGAASGAAVCVFGMWAFLKGQSTMLDIGSGGRPSLTEKDGEHGNKGLAAQFRSMFGDAGAAERGKHEA